MRVIKLLPAIGIATIITTVLLTNTYKTGEALTMLTLDQVPKIEEPETTPKVVSLKNYELASDDNSSTDETKKKDSTSSDSEPSESSESSQAVQSEQCEEQEETNSETKESSSTKVDLLEVIRQALQGATLTSSQMLLGDSGLSTTFSHSKHISTLMDALNKLKDENK